jgi:hypothetical protein
MKNQTKATKAMDAYNALLNNVMIIEGLCNKVTDDGKIEELQGADQSASQIADVLDDIHLVLTANSNSGAASYNAATAMYTVSADSYISNTATNSVEIARIDFGNFLAAGVVKWADISNETTNNDAAFLSNLSALKVALSTFRDSVASFLL